MKERVSNPRLSPFLFSLSKNHFAFFFSLHLLIFQRSHKVSSM
ncbi:hypothetical protein HMPREF1554_02249 [Porphyromonas gingivalis F0569]|nr:hypothetical protein HMPREF1554_02249 [Porphyromonas gingivalis F0569]